jgi:hypothetical protein
MVFKSEEKRHLGIPTNRWKDNIEANLKYNGRACIGLVWLGKETNYGMF